LINHIIAHASNRGISQAALARRAKITSEALSRLKKADGCRLGTLLDLARAAGFTALTLGDRPKEAPAAATAARKLSAGRRDPISSEALVRALASPKRVAGEGLHVHLLGFFEELPLESVHDVILEGHLDYTSLAALARELGAEGETVEWLEEMAGHGVA